MVVSICSRREEMAKVQPFEAGSTERVRKLNAALSSTPRTICLHRARAYTEIFSQTEDEPNEVRFAKAFTRTLKDLPPIIAENELIVGAPTCRIRGTAVFPEVSGAWLRGEIDTLSSRQWMPCGVTPQQVQEVKEIMRYWQGRTLYDRWAKACPSGVVTKVIGKGWADSGWSVYSNGYHFTPPWELILHNGISWYEDQVREALANSTNTEYSDLAQMGGNHFYQALLMTTAAIKDFAGKYSQKARELAGQESDPKRKEELLSISEALERVPYHGARSFREAVQSLCFIMVLLHIECTGPTYTTGRIDQYLYPFYEADIQAGSLSRQEALELIECLFIKLSGIFILETNQAARVHPGYRNSQTISLGGVDTTGKDASNDLSYLCLEAAESLRSIVPDVVLLYHPRETPYSLKMKAAELVTMGLGIPKIINTEIIKSELMNVGYSTNEAGIGWIQGCTEPYGPGCKQYGHSVGSRLNLPMALEAVLFNGRKRTPNQPGSGDLLGRETGDPRQFNNFNEFLDAVKAQIAQQISDGHTASSWAAWVKARYFPILLQSLFTDACIERGLSANAGGAKIYVGPGIAPSGGVGTFADSLAAIKKLVFEEKKISMAELLKAVDANFDGYETTRQMLINHAPKFGNDNDYVDDLARQIWQFVNDEVQKHITPFGNRNVASTCTPMASIVEGTKTWATPDGRKAGQPFSNHVGPTDGLDVNGAVGNINSVTKLDMSQHWGAIHNLYFVNVDSEEKMHQMIDLIDLFISRGGYHVQINCQDKQVFIDAQKHPMRYQGLMVRVAGYVAYFVELPKELQDQIIGRTSHYV
ncbi:pyruvate formate lyase family protein [Chloroflexota bacterium]